MKMTIDRSTFIRTFEDYGRLDNFSAWGLNQLFDYFEQYEQDSGEQIEFDCIAICCEYSETTIKDAKDDYGQNELTDEEFIEYLQENTQLVAYDDENVIYQAF